MYIPIPTTQTTPTAIPAVAPMLSLSVDFLGAALGKVVGEAVREAEGMDTATTGEAEEADAAMIGLHLSVAHCKKIWAVRD